ncbi:aminotransferase class III-fold pyridoxal phosphate-dependent enzyme [Lutimonas saemankumensis]|uniref:aspartate aminotransferase family protein n=1 Tax=Lutimonas saemankumensis TaxID=483016 RepID=UPI001CD771C7|nr:aminotransferase class III-fold pyridoxal phosphate-dependent enzyme [Lutimonas saemankumensis]MCA0933470.1 aminotransferase class III-fold pyridoxal phosphate-dependent enzyme [Lutimonas saemankumensis]
MELFDVYPLYNVTPVRARGCYVIDDNGKSYLDLYGGHGVISIGHSHEQYVKRLSEQLSKMGFYSNSIKNPLQEELAGKLGEISGCPDYNLFLCNSGAEANENALKMASFETGKKKIVAFHKAFHGRTSAAVAATDNIKINAPLNKQQEVVFLPLNDVGALETELKKGDTAAVIIEGIQGVGGLNQGSKEFFQALESLCRQYHAVLILDEIQSGFGRSGKFFSFQHHGIQPDIISMAKGMGNGFPIGGILISNKIKASYGLLGTTFGGNHLACAACLAVLEVISDEGLMDNVKSISKYFLERIKEIGPVKAVKGKGLMLGASFDFPVAELRKSLIYEEGIFTGGSSDPNLLRILPPLSVGKKEIDLFIEALKNVLTKMLNHESS